jgi:hypothetical protein
MNAIKDENPNSVEYLRQEKTFHGGSLLRTKRHSIRQSLVPLCRDVVGDEPRDLANLLWR